jgi:hypothetical protein
LTGRPAKSSSTSVSIQSWGGWRRTISSTSCSPKTVKSFDLRHRHSCMYAPAMRGRGLRPASLSKAARCTPTRDKRSLHFACMCVQLLSLGLLLKQPFRIHGLLRAKQPFHIHEHRCAQTDTYIHICRTHMHVIRCICRAPYTHKQSACYDHHIGLAHSCPTAHCCIIHRVHKASSSIALASANCVCKIYKYHPAIAGLQVTGETAYDCLAPEQKQSTCDVYCNRFDGTRQSIINEHCFDVFIYNRCIDAVSPP